MKSTRMAFIFVSLITLALLIGSVVLQRIVFKAAESESTFYAMPTSFSVQPGGTVALSLRSNFSIPAYVVAGQVAIEYSPAQLEYVEIVPTGDFVTKKVTNSDGTVLWAFVPAPNYGLVARLRGEVVVGEINFKALAESATTIAVDPSQTIISAIDPEGTNALYNAVVSTQGSVGQISDTATASVVTAPTATEQGIPEAQGSLQQIIRLEVVPYPTEAVVLTQLRYLGKVEVYFGLSADSLTQKVSSVATSTDHDIRLSGLLAGQQYFYQLRTLTSNGDYGSISQVKTFTAPLASIEFVSPTVSELLAVSPMTSRLTDVYAKLRAADGGAADSTGVEFRVVSGEAIVTATDDTLPRATVQTLSSQKQKVVVEVVAGETVIARTSLLFDPTVEQLAEPDQSISQTLPFNRTVQLTLLAVLIILLTTGLVLARLFRV